MPIQILPPQLANQIAAGEVVERPASVVKELVENSLDAGANRIQIDIENGGASLIRIRDNGIGIAKAELSLALARHATSKISSIEDLESILSLGFRGEALASISSVSRLTLTSRTAEQNEAWQVYVQGREQQSTISPASHPVGTTVEVANLFFNTPARRKFLRTDKTEFAHIDEVIRRIALAKPHIAFTLTHNGKTIRQYKTALQQPQILKRVAAICGEDFMQNALHIDWKHDDLHLSGWVATPNFQRAQNDLSYCYINGRMVKDKVITHAIRQAYSASLAAEKYPAFVLFLDLNPQDVDVNVHPTKHEVRFHQSRLIHDFICQGVNNALLSAEQLDFSLPADDENPALQIAEPAADYQPQSKANRAAAGDNIFAQNFVDLHRSSAVKPSFNAPQKPIVSKTQQRVYGELLQNQPFAPIEPAPVQNQSTPIAPAKSTLEIQAKNESQSNPSMLQALALVQDQALLLQQQGDFYLLPLAQLQRLHIELSLQNQPSQQPLLIPLVLRLTAEQLQHWQQQKTWWAQIGFDFVENLAQQRITIYQTPQCLRQQNLQKMLLSLLAQSPTKLSDFYTALLRQLEFSPINIFATALHLLQQVEQQLNQANQLQQYLIKVDFNPYLTRLNHE